MGTMLIPFILLSNAVIAYGHVRGCYYINRAQYQLGEGEFLLDDIPKGLCTHILYAFAKVDQSDLPIDIRTSQNGTFSKWNQNEIFEWNDEDTDWSRRMYSHITKLKENDPELKILLSYGGYNFGSSTFTAIAKSADKRRHFIESAIAFLRKNEFDGFSLDWEYSIGVAQEHGKIVEEMKEAFMEEAKKSGSEQLLLTAAVSAKIHAIDQSYNVQCLGKNLDLLFLMSYDFHGSWEKNVDLHAKLRPTKGETSGKCIFNTEFAASYWVSKGMPKPRIIIGIPTYGQGWTLRNSSKTTIGAEGIRPSSPSTTNPAGGTAAYWEICKYLKEGGKETIDEQGVGAYMVKGNQWYGYDNEETIKIKMRWLKEKGYGGAFIWTLDFDDFKGLSCGKGPYPLLSAINYELEGESTVSTKSFETTTVTSKSTENDEIKTTKSAVEPTRRPRVECPEPYGLFQHPTDCRSFIHCAHNHPYIIRCPPKTFFNDEIKVCDHLWNAPNTCK